MALIMGMGMALVSDDSLTFFEAAAIAADDLPENSCATPAPLPHKQNTAATAPKKNSPPYPVGNTYIVYYISSYH